MMISTFQVREEANVAGCVHGNHTAGTVGGNHPVVQAEQPICTWKQLFVVAGRQVRNLGSLPLSDDDECKCADYY